MGICFLWGLCPSCSSSNYYTVILLVKAMPSYALVLDVESVVSVPRVVDRLFLFRSAGEEKGGKGTNRLFDRKG